MKLVLLKMLNVDQDYAVCILQNKDPLEQSFYAIAAIYKFPKDAKDTSHDFSIKVQNIEELKAKALDRIIDVRERRISALCYAYLLGREE